MLKNNKKIVNAVVIAAALALPVSAAPIYQSSVLADETTNQNTNSNRTVSVQNLYANVYDQESGQYLGRYLLDTETGYTDSPHRMFNYTLPQIDGYGYIANLSMIPVDWTNPSGVTEVTVYVVKKSSDLYKQTYGYKDQNQSQSNSSGQHQPRRNEDGLMLDNEGKPMLRDLYHRYRAFLGYPCPGDSSDPTASSHLIYLFEKYFGYNPNKSKAQNYIRMDKNLPKKSQNQTNASSSSSAKSKKKFSDAKPKSTKKFQTEAEAAKDQNKEKSSNLPVILTSTVALIIAAAAIIWGFMKMRKPQKVHKHQRR